MHYTNWDKLTPPREILNQCHKIEVDGDRHSLAEARRWARAQGLGLIWIEEADFSDISSWRGPDYLLTFYFSNEHDATLFQLMWS